MKKDSTVYVGDLYERNTATQEVTKYYYANGQRIAMRKGGTLYYLTQDHLGGTALVTDSNGAMVSRVRYYPYGGIRSEELGPGVTSLPTDKLFTGQQRETDNGIYHYNARLYNADIGRFPQADTVIPDARDPGALNRYSYVYNSPTNYNDPTGHFGAGFGVALEGGAPGLTPVYSALLWVGALSPFEKGGPCWLGAGSYPGNWICNPLLDLWRDETIHAAQLLGNYFEINMLAWSYDQRDLLRQSPDTFGEIDTGSSDEVSYNTAAAIALVVGAISPSSIQMHHPFVKEMFFRAWFDSAGIDPLRLKVPITAAQHILKIGDGVHTGPNNLRAYTLSLKIRFPNPTRAESQVIIRAIQRWHSQRGIWIPTYWIDKVRK